MSNLRVTYHELFNHLHHLNIRVVDWKHCRPGHNFLGNGASMNVFSGICRIDGADQEVAFKFVKKLTEKTPSRKRDEVLKDVRQEIRIMGILKGHPYIVQLLAVAFNDHNPVLILELANKLSLDDYLEQNEVSWKLKLKFAYNVAVGLAAIHKAGIIHGDLKASNILIFAKDDGRIIAKISDFGFSCTEVSVQAGRLPGTSKHFRPLECFDVFLEDWRGKRTVDIYAYGLVMWQMGTNGDLPFKACEESEIDNLKETGTELKYLLKDLPVDTPEEIKSVMHATIRKRPSERASLDKIINMLNISSDSDSCCSYDEVKQAFESLPQNGAGETLWVSKMATLSIPPSLKKSIYQEYFALAVAGDSVSKNRLGSCLALGFGTEQNDSKAFEIWKEAAETGIPQSQVNLGNCYLNGQGVAADPSLAVYWYARSAEAGDYQGQYNLGFCYERGRGVVQDCCKAVELYAKAANAGYVKAQTALGICYMQGRGVKIDQAKALELFMKAAQKGDARALWNLGMFYSQGKGVELNKSKASRLYHMAADAGKAFAQYNIGIMYYKGRGVSKNINKARKYLELAAAQGHTQAERVLERLSLSK